MGTISYGRTEGQDEMMKLAVGKKKDGSVAKFWSCFTSNIVSQLLVRERERNTVKFLVLLLLLLPVQHHSAHMQLKSRGGVWQRRQCVVKTIKGIFSGLRAPLSVIAGSEVKEGRGAVSPFSQSHTETQRFLSTSALGRRRPGAILQTPAPSKALHGVAAKTRVRGHIPELEDCPPHHPIGHVEGRSAGDPCTTAAQIEGGSSYFLHSFVWLSLTLTPVIQTSPHVWNIHLWLPDCIYTDRSLVIFYIYLFASWVFKFLTICQGQKISLLFHVFSFFGVNLRENYQINKPSVLNLNSPLQRRQRFICFATTAQIPSICCWFLCWRTATKKHDGFQVGGWINKFLK